MKGGDLVSQDLHDPDIDFPSLEAALERGLVGQAPHLDRPLDHPAIHFHAQSPATSRHWHDAKIDLWGQTAVEAHLLLTIMPALGHGAEVEKPERNGFFDFVDIGAGQEDSRDMGLPHLYLPNRIGVG